MIDHLLRFVALTGAIAVLYGLGDTVTGFIAGTARTQVGLATIAVGACLFSVAYMALCLRAEGRR